MKLLKKIIKLLVPSKLHPWLGTTYSALRGNNHTSSPELTQAILEQDLFSGANNQILVYTTSFWKYALVDLLAFFLFVPVPFARRNPNFILLELSKGNIAKSSQERIAITQLCDSIRIETPFKRCQFVNRLCRLICIGEPFLMEQKISADLVIFDSMYPLNADFRFHEFDAYARKFESFASIANCVDWELIEPSFATLPMLQKKKYYEDSIFENKPTHKIIFRDGVWNKSNLVGLDFSESKLLYTVFLRQIYDIIVENKVKIPFVFTLYPGGCFAIDDAKSDQMLKRVFSSPYFRKVIVTQKITYDYLITKGLCEKNKIVFIFGGVINPDFFHDEMCSQKKFYGDGKKTLDICFVARRHSFWGDDKGYDIFQQLAKQFSLRHQDVRFHVVGTGWEKVPTMENFNDFINFYGYIKQKDLGDFFKDKDIILSPNRPFIIGPGYFDGFVPGSVVEASLHSVAFFASDELNMNHGYYENHVEAEIISPELANYLEVLEKYYTSPEKIKLLAFRGAARTRELNSPKVQIDKRIEVIREALSNECN